MKYAVFFVALMIFFSSVKVCAQQAVEGKAGEWLSNNNIKLIVRSFGEITNFDDFNLEESSVVNPYKFKTFKAALAKGEVKVIMADITVQNLSSVPKQLGHRPKLAVRGEFFLEIDSGFDPQDSGNRKEYFGVFSETGVVVSARKLMETVNGLYPENIIVPPSGEVSGQILFIVPSNFSPAVFCNVVDSNIVIGPFWVKLK